jgi:hypothetical protein
MIRVRRSGAGQAVATAVHLTKVALVSSAVVLVVIDGGSCVVARMSVTDQVKDAGLAALQAVEGQPLTQRTVERAYQAASAVAAPSATVDADGPTGFSMTRDGSVTLTLRRTAPTLLLHRIGPLAEHADAHATWTQRPARY